MLQFEHIETRLLIDMLAGYTEKFSHLFRLHKPLKPSRGYLRCKYTIEAILNALDKRHGVPKKEKETHIARYEAVCLSN